MIPTAQVLADILNDPAIPAEALPDSHAGSTTVRNGKMVVNPDSVADLNAALYWSLSAWLWGRDVYVWVEPSRHGGWFAAEDCGEGGPHVYPTAPSPVEALAAVVREVAALGTLPP